MTQEQENDYIILWTLALRPRQTKQQFYFGCAALGVDVELFTGNERSSKYIEFIENVTPSIIGKPDSLEPGEEFLVKITLQGKNYLRWLEQEKEKELIDLKIKKLSLSQNKSQRITTYLSLAVAILSALSGIFVPFRVRELDKNKKTEVSIQQLQKTQITLQAILKNVEDLHRTVKFKDTSTKKANIEN